MAKYNYDKSALKGLSVGPFLNEVKTRNEEIEKAPDTMPTSIYNANILAGRLHPAKQFGKIVAVKEDKGAKTYVIAPDEARGEKELAYFRAGQYLSVALDIGDAKLCRPYTLSSGPKDALGPEGNTYALTIKENGGSFATSYIMENWKAGTQVIISAPLGDFYYTKLRDAKTVVAVAGGSGITPFMSMASAIADGIEDFELIILYGSKKHDEIILKDELEAAAKRAGGKVKVIHVLSDEVMEGYENGFITADLIKKYAPAGDYSLFACGSKGMYKFLKGEAEKLGLPKRRVRFDVGGSYGDPTGDEAYPKDKAGKQYHVTVLVRGESYDLMGDAEESLLSTCERAGIRVPSDCRSGQCGWCHSRLVSGEVYVPEIADGRRLADKKFGWIHPCVSYPISDVTIEVFPALES